MLGYVAQSARLTCKHCWGQWSKSEKNNNRHVLKRIRMNSSCGMYKDKTTVMVDLEVIGAPGKFGEQCGGLFLHIWFELLDAHPCVSLRRRPGTRQRRPRRISISISSSRGGSGKMPSLAGAPLVSEEPPHLSGLFCMFSFPFPTILCVVVLQIISLGFLCFLRLEELNDVVFPSLSLSSHCLACFVIPFLLLF